MTIYVVTKGEYSDYHIVAATLDKERAEKIAKKFSDRWEECMVEEYEDSEAALKHFWFITFKKGVNEIDICKNEDTCAYALHVLNRPIKRRDGIIEIYVAADTSEEAIKIASEKRAEYLAKKEGVC